MKEHVHFTTNFDKPHTSIDELHGQREAGDSAGGLPNKQRHNSKKALRKAHLTDKLKVIFSSIVGQITSGSIQASFDQLIFSLRSKLPVQDVKQSFATVLGEPGESYDRKFWLFKTSIGQFELSRTRENTKFCHIIKLRNLQILPLLEPIIANFPPHGNSPSAAKISSAEVAYDIPLPNLSYEQAERVLRELMLFLVPYRNRHAELSRPLSKQLKDTTDGTRNGRLTAYFGKHRDLIDKKNPKKEKRVHADTSWQGKIYLKAFRDENGNLGPWHIRLEVTLADRALKRIGGNLVSFDPDAMQNRLQGLALSNFWRVEAFDWHRFIGEAEAVRAKKSRVVCANNDRRAGGKLIAPLLLIRYSGEVDLGDYHGAKIERKQLREHFSFTVRRKRRAYAIARRLNDERLTRQIRKGRFRIPVKLT